MALTGSSLVKFPPQNPVVGYDEIAALASFKNAQNFSLALAYAAESKY